MVWLKGTHSGERLAFILVCAVITIVEYIVMEDVTKLFKHPSVLGMTAIAYWNVTT